MKTRGKRIGATYSFLLVPALLGVAGAARAQSDWQEGSIFLEVGNGDANYRVYDPLGVYQEVFSAMPGLSGFGTAAFRGGGDLWVAITGEDLKTESFVDRVRSVDQAHPHAGSDEFDLYGNGIEWPTALAFDAQGGFFVSVYFGGVRRVIGVNSLYSGMFPVQVLSGSLGTLALAPDQRTLFYATLDRVERYDLATHTQLGEYLDASNDVFDFALLPPFDGSGGVIAALNQSVQRFDAAGVRLNIYDYLDLRFWNHVSLHPDGVSFWSMGKSVYGSNAQLIRFDIESGELLQGPIDAGTYLVSDLLVRGEPVGGSAAPEFDAPTPCASAARAYVGVPFTFDVAGSDINFGDTVTLTAESLPIGATMTPALPVTGNPATSTLQWTPGADDAGDHAMTFKLTDYIGNERACTLTVTVEPGAPYCFGDGLDPVVTAQCPCTNFGDPGHGCANSNAALGGARLYASGATNPNTVLFQCTSVPNNTLCTFFQTVTSIPAGFVFGDGVRCVNTPLIRFGQQNSGQNGNPANTAEAAPIVTPYGFTRHYQCQYRNPAPAFCPPATFNMSNAYTIAW